MKRIVWAGLAGGLVVVSLGIRLAHAVAAGGDGIHADAGELAAARGDAAEPLGGGALRFSRNGGRAQADRGRGRCLGRQVQNGSERPAALPPGRHRTDFRRGVSGSSSRPISRVRFCSPTCWSRSPASTGAQVPLAKMLRISAVAGVFSWASISVAYWNWYGFPRDFVLAELVDQLVAWTLAGLVMALLWRRTERRAILQAERHLGVLTRVSRCGGRSRS